MKLAFLDVETTGTSPANGGIIEVGLILTEDLEVRETYSTLVNPKQHVSPYIEMLTGISNGDLTDAPHFDQIAIKLLTLLEDATLVAHNVNFDYSFLKEEFQRTGYDYLPKRLCSVRMFRHLHPERRRHNLDELMRTFDIQIENRHRALDDARVVYDFFKIIKDRVGDDPLKDVVDKLTSTVNLPETISRKDFGRFSENHGVYTFYAKDGAPLYVGKSNNIKKRLLSHFTTSALDTTKLKLIENTHRIETIETAGELGALLLESKLIKELMPIHNKRLRAAKSLTYLSKTTNEAGYYEVEIVRSGDPTYEELKDSVGIFKTNSSAKMALSKMSDEYGLCEALLGLNNTKPCFKYRLGRCSGACHGIGDPDDYNKIFDEAFKRLQFKTWPHDGPITISEESEELGIKDTHVVDKWCYLGKMDADQSLEDFTELAKDLSFDFDTYKILRRWI